MTSRLAQTAAAYALKTVARQASALPQIKVSLADGTTLSKRAIPPRDYTLDWEYRTPLPKLHAAWLNKMPCAQASALQRPSPCAACSCGAASRARALPKTAFVTLPVFSVRDPEHVVQAIEMLLAKAPTATIRLMARLSAGAYAAMVDIDRSQAAHAGLVGFLLHMGDLLKAHPALGKAAAAPPEVMAADQCQQWGMAPEVCDLIQRYPAAKRLIPPVTQVFTALPTDAVLQALLQADSFAPQHLDAQRVIFRALQEVRTHVTRQFELMRNGDIAVPHVTAKVTVD